jgi:recombination protein RecT
LSGEGVKKSLLNSLGSEKSMAKFTSSILSAVSVSPQLQECDFGTIISAGLLANALDLSLSPSLGLAYIVPFNDNKNNRKVATFILGYRGYIQLAIRSGYYRKINVVEIKEGELLKFDPLNEEIEVSLIQDEEERERAKTIGYYAMFEHINGFRKAIYWSKQKMLRHADKYSKAFSLEATKGKYPKASFADFEAGKVPESDMWKYSSYWYSDFDGMAKKTMIRQLISKWGIMSIEMSDAYDKDSKATEKVENSEFDNAFTTEEAREDFFSVSESAEKAEAKAEKVTTTKRAKTKPAAEDVIDEKPEDFFAGTPFEG